MSTFWSRVKIGDEDSCWRAVAERPILFSAPMVRAILDGRKTQTRRVARMTACGHVRRAHRRWHPGDPDASAACPYGQPGDLLWVRETWGIIPNGPDDYPYVIWQADRAVDWCDGNSRSGDVHYVSSDAKPNHWRPSIHMPRWASRITLEVVGARVERLQALTEEDARAEGCASDAERIAESGDMMKGLDSRALPTRLRSARDGFRDLWNTINAKRATWGSNPWVWRVEFRRAL